MAGVLLLTKLKRCGGTSLLAPKDTLMHCSRSLSVTSAVGVFLKTMQKPCTGTDAHMQRVTLTLQLNLKGFIHSVSNAHE
jgi:hypothetical protein